MSTIDEVLAAAEVVDAVCVIDGETRIISVPAEYKELGVESDEKVTRVKFQCPKIVGDNVDLTECNLYINYRNAGNKLNSYLVEDVTVTGDTINFSWLLSRHVTESPGTISYIVCAKKSDDTGVINEWNTKVATGIVGIGLEATEEIEEQNIDAIEQILRSIVELENKVDGGGSGGYYAPAVDNEGNLTWAASKADMPAVDGANIKGPRGKSAYQYAQEGGYTGTEAAFAAKLAKEIPEVDVTLTESGQAADAKTVGDAIISLSIVKPVEKTAEMIQPVGVDSDGRLWTAPVNGTTAEEPNYEQVGVAPYVVTESGLFVSPDAETRIYTEGGRENLLANIQNVVDGPWGVTTMDYTVSGNTVTVNSAEISNALWAMFTIYGIYIEPGDYTFQMQGCKSMAVDLHTGTSADDSSWSNSSDIASNIKNEAVYNFTVTEGTYLKISPKKFNNSTWPVTLKFFLVAGTYDTIPDETISLSFTVAAGEKFSLDAFNGTTMYSDPDGVAVYRPVENAATDNEIVICFGDSIMTYCKVPAALNELGINAVDMAASGACLSGGRDVATHPYDMCHIVDALESGDLTAQINGGSQPNFESLLSLMPSTTTLLIEFGTNDFQGLVALEGEDKTSITGGLRYVLSKLCTMYPAKKIVVISTLGWTLAGNTNDISLTLEQLNDALRNVASEYNIPFIDALHGVGLNTYTRNALTTDGCHLNAVGVQRYAKFLSGQLSALGI